MINTLTLTHYTFTFQGWMAQVMPDHMAGSMGNTQVWTALISVQSNHMFLPHTWTYWVAEVHITQDSIPFRTCQELPSPSHPQNSLAQTPLQSTPQPSCPNQRVSNVTQCDPIRGWDGQLAGTEWQIGILTLIQPITSSESLANAQRREDLRGEPTCNCIGVLYSAHS